MPVEMIGWIAPRVASELIPAEGPPFDAEVIAHTARVHEDADFDRVLIGYFSEAPDGFLIGAHAASVTERLGLLLAHRPGFVAPTLAARKIATLDQLSGGRTAVHMISGGNDADQAKDGDYADHAARYRRTREYTRLLKQSWLEQAPFSHKGEFYQVDKAWAEIRCAQEPRVPIYGGGGSDAAVEWLAPDIDVFMLWGEPLAADCPVHGEGAEGRRQQPHQLQRFHAPDPRQNRRRGMGPCSPPSLNRSRHAWGGRKPGAPQNIGSQRLLALAADKDVHDGCLWTKLAAGYRRSR